MKTFLTTLAALGLLAINIHAQEAVRLSPGDVEIKGFDFQAQQTPDFQASGPKSKNIPIPREWLELEIEFEVDADRDSVINKLMFRYYIGIRDQQGNPVVLTGDTQHINVIASEKSYSAVYVSPNTLGTLTGDFRRFQPSAILGVGVEVFYNGVMVGKKSDTNNYFWESPSVSQRPGVLPKHETPFALLWLDRYADVEKAN